MLCSISVLGMLISVYMSKSVQGNANIINQIGSIRMQTYHLLSEPPSIQESNSIIENIEHHLQLPSFIKYINKEKLNNEYKSVTKIWFQQLKPYYIHERNRDEQRRISKKFLYELNNIISIIDHKTEKTIRNINNVQVLFLFIIISFTYIAIFSLKKRLFQPWTELLAIAKNIKQGKFDQKFNSNNYKDEMGELGESINSMTESLKTMYSNLEKLVDEKTEQLHTQNRYLDFLYRSCQLFNNNINSYSNCESLHPLIKELMLLTHIKQIHISLFDSQQSDSFQYFHYGVKQRPDFCNNTSCNLCFNIENKSSQDLKCRRRSLNDTLQQYGYIDIFIDDDLILSAEEEQFILAFCDLLTQSLSIYYKEQNQQQLILLKERNTIARELHDSIAQSLSCLKIKISLLQMEQASFNKEQRQLIQEMREELNVAYRQLRELLTTFRLKLDGIGFVPALQNTILEFNQKIGLNIESNYHIPANTLTNHQAIHLLQIIREALNNIYKHANATKISLDLTTQNHHIILTLMDNGSGINKPDDSFAHIGLTIINDRANSLAGKWSIKSKPNEGTLFFLTFPITSGAINKQNSTDKPNHNPNNNGANNDDSINRHTIINDDNESNGTIY